MVILIHGAANNHDDLFAAAYKLDGVLYNLITTFYNICEREKCKVPPNEVKIYDEFLNSTTNSRRSISSE